MYCSVARACDIQAVSTMCSRRLACCRLQLMEESAVRYKPLVINSHSLLEQPEVGA